ncbi:uncharacterized protein L969DRAFT_93060 [Mixia osmundae IAM 14324]|uniref:PIPK domain-containing protein n=1 Tax=Mixia osmundae (strain CBS 9802 / IAM 14324 / JCM 22182 / KY 12970) TaxID=764103 RepID=G7E681_MIXOS|nr:uncharacterized protein L969DRAFT_93060 [Mixia osmundae IAM 14324]KEI40505.1 hypothetical protein L969DRAFT_93060 [Mixia osmundae IAM 14324]GAA98341.1 hypothetical protein E5Q_05026 [Mixia osmundae IAM 14324]
MDMQASHRAPSSTDLKLDAASIGHLTKLAAQCERQAKLASASGWPQLLLDALNQILALQTVEKLAELERASQARYAALDAKRLAAKAQATGKAQALKREASMSKVLDRVKDDPVTDGAGIDSSKGLRFTVYLNTKPQTSSETRAVHFRPDQYIGEPLFTPSEPESECLESQVRRTGGTICLRGPNSELQKLRPIVQLLLFAATHLLLEMYLLRDFGIVRPEETVEIPVKVVAADPRRPSVSLSVFSDPGPKIEEEVDLSKTLRSHRSSFLSTFLRPAQSGRALDRSSTLQPAPQSNGSKISKLVGKLRLSHRLRSSSIDPAEARDKQQKSVLRARGLLDAWELLASDSSTLDDVPAVEGPTTPVKGIVEPDNPAARFQKVIDTLKNTIISTSPDVVVPPPHLLVKLQQQEAAIREQEKEGSIKPTMTIDARAGLGSLLTNNDSVEGVLKHQSLTMLLFEQATLTLSTELRSVDNPSWITLSYGDFHKSDLTLGRLLKLCRQAVDADEQDHQILLAHGTTRLALRCRRRKPTAEEALVASRCRGCCQTTTFRSLSAPSLLMSFAKYCELRLYDTAFCSPDLLCSHDKDPVNIEHIFAFGTLTCEISSTKVDLYEMRLPSSATHPAPLALQDSQCANTVSVQATDLDERSQLRKEVSEFYDSFQLAVDAGVVSSSPGKDETVSKAKRDAVALQTLGREATAHQAQLVEQLSSGSTTSQIRRDFRAQALLDDTKLSVLRKKLPKETVGETVKPDYVCTACHLMPGIAAREDEPSSWIAHSLSSTDYLAALSDYLAALQDDHDAKSDSLSDASEIHTPDYQSVVRQTRRQKVEHSKTIRTLTSLATRGLKNGSVILPAGKAIESTEGAPLSVKTDLDDAKVLADLLNSTSPDAEQKRLPKWASGRSTPSLIKSVNKRSTSRQQVSITSADFFAPSPKSDLSLTLPLSGDQNTGQSSFLSIRTPSPGLNEMQSTYFPAKATSRPGSIASSASATSLLDPLEPCHLRHVYEDDHKQFTVTHWYADKFAGLRAACGIDEDTFVNSLSRCTATTNSGGKSKSAFYTTADERFLLKTMLSSWHAGSEIDYVLDFCQAYFDKTLETDSHQPSVMVKLFGMYSLQMRDVKTSETTQLDIVIQEQIFYKQRITKTYDLKGIGGRRKKQMQRSNKATSGSDVKTKEPSLTRSATTKWDAEWIDDVKQSSVLLQPHSKRILREAIHNDLAWLQQHNLIDFSLLVGCDEQSHELVVGLIDCLGHFSLAKLIETKSKRAIRSAEDVTVLPPDEYAKRFENNVNRTFVSVPAKFTKVDSLPRRELSCPL